MGESKRETMKGEGERIEEKRREDRRNEKEKKRIRATKLCYRHALPSTAGARHLSAEIFFFFLGKN